MAREHNDFINAGDISPETTAIGPFAGAGKRMLSHDSESAAETAILLLPPGWSGDLRGLEGTLELVILAGEVRLGQHLMEREGWARAPRPAVLGTLSTTSGAEILAMTDPTAHDDGDPVIVDVRSMPWQHRRRSGPDAITIKPLYNGATISFIAHQRAQSETGPEFHECPEELYVLSGDVTGRYGTMRSGSYFWRPEYITHGPYRSESGMVCLVRGHGDIVAHWIDRADATVDENKAYAEKLPPAARSRKGGF